MLNFGMQNFSHHIFCKETFSNWRLNEKGKKSVFQRETGHISETLTDTAKVRLRLLLVTNTPFQIK